MVLQEGDKVKVLTEILISEADAFEEKRVIYKGESGIATGEMDRESHRIQFNLGKYFLEEYEFEVIK